jgi:hypothetical protein
MVGCKLATLFHSYHNPAIYLEVGRLELGQYCFQNLAQDDSKPACHWLVDDLITTGNINDYWLHQMKEY